MGIVTEQDAWLLLNAVTGLSLRRKHALVARTGDPRAVLALSDDRLAELCGPKAASKIAAARTHTADALRAQAQRLGLRILTLADTDYPDCLRTIVDPPLAVYVRGQVPPDPRVGVVGTRRPSHEGEEVAFGIGRDLAQAGVCVVSGLARGIDAAAHRGALEASGPTIAVLACGLDQVYPPEHRDLADRIAHRGGLISEHPPGTPPLPHHFPARNRIVSGLARAVVVVEARLRSGALITADFALEQGREVFAVPGSVLNPRSRGPHRLLRDGAHLAESADDVLELLGIPLPARSAPLSADDRALLDVLSQPRHPDEIAGSCPGGAAALGALLTSLELRGAVRRLAGGRYVRTVR
ncbi:MAG: DNA-processing protein DprA [Armatimonadota bacterium]|nr:DNA-processing protein DprA [Armatimonadota bacterium]MDR5697758.1 DNA-processing protein DprA [Armatimonadota bacterium]